MREKCVYVCVWGREGVNEGEKKREGQGNMREGQGKQRDDREVREREIERKGAIWNLHPNTIHPPTGCRRPS